MNVMKRQSQRKAALDNGDRSGQSALLDAGNAPTIKRRPGAAETNPQQHEARRKWVSLALSIGTPILLIAAWQLASEAGSINPQFFPPPSRIWTTGVDMVRDGDLQTAIGVSSRRILLGFALGVVSGVLVGVLMATSWVIRAALDPLLSALYTVPKLALLPLLLLIFGIGETPKVLIIGITVFFFMWISTMAAVASVGEGYLEALQSFNASRWQVFRHALLPASLPQIFVGMRISAGVSVLVVVGVEFVQGGSGIGNVIWFSWSLFRAAQRPPAWCSTRRTPGTCPYT